MDHNVKVFCKIKFINLLFLFFAFSSLADPITVEGKEIEKIQRIIKQSIKLIEIDTKVQDLRVVRNRGVESILFEIPVPTDFKETETFKIQCNKKLKDAYPDCEVKIEFKSQISMG